MWQSVLAGFLRLDHCLPKYELLGCQAGDILFPEVSGVFLLFQGGDGDKLGRRGVKLVSHTGWRTAVL